MQKVVIVTLLAGLAGLGAFGNGGATPCTMSGGETVAAIEITGADGKSVAFLYQSPTPADGQSGLWFNTNKFPGLQTTDMVRTCGSVTEVERAADQPALDYVTP